MLRACCCSVFQNRSAGEADALTSNREGEGAYFSISSSRFSIYTVLLTTGKLILSMCDEEKAGDVDVKDG